MIRTTIFLAIFTLSLASCKSEYERKVASELASGERHDSLFFGFYFGMEQKDFFAHCWDLNKKGFWKEGSMNTSVQYSMTELKYPAVMDFYPNFEQGRIFEMPVFFAYKAWAPWNKEQHADKLLLDVLGLFKKWYGEDFMEIKDGQGNVLFVKVDGNRRITLYQEPLQDQYVKALMVDLPVWKEVKERRKGKEQPQKSSLEAQ